MQNRLISLIICVATLISLQVSAETICSDDNFKSSLQVNALNLSQLKIKSLPRARLYLIGETHFFQGYATQQRLLEMFSKQLGKNVCLFFELPSSQTPQQQVDEAKNERPLASKDPFFQLVNEEFINHFEPLINLAKGNGVKVFSVDKASQFKLDTMNRINDRDEGMTKRITELFASKSCSSGIMFVGADHIGPDSYDRRTLSSRLRETRIPLLTFNIVHESDPGPIEMASWNKLCDNSLVDFGNETVIFSNASIRPYTRVSPNNEYSNSLWSNFEYTILAP